MSSGQPSCWLVMLDLDGGRATTTGPDPWSAGVSLQARVLVEQLVRVGHQVFLVTARAADDRPSAPVVCLPVGEPDGVDLQPTVTMPGFGPTSDRIRAVLELLKTLPMPTGQDLLPGRPSASDQVGIGHAALRLMVLHAGYRILFVGNDTADEAAILAVRQAGGVGVRVGKGKTQALFRVADIGGVGGLLRAL